MSGKRSEYLSKNEMYMLIAYVASLRSKDPNSQVGCCIVSKEDRILSIGYNGMPNGCSDDEFPWEREAEKPEDTKYLYVCHSEANAILNFRGDNTAFQGATIFVTLFPCEECTKLIIQSGIKHIYYLSDKYHDTPGHRAAVKMLDAVGITYEQYEIDHDREVLAAKKLMTFFHI